jgi:hypothetical protein
VVDGGVAKIQALETAFGSSFPYASVSAAMTEFSVQDVSSVEGNAAVNKAVSTTLDAVASMTQDAQTLESFLHLHIPKMEDGNNFGVTVQLALLKEIGELQEAATKILDDLVGYAGARADALEKLKLPSTASSTTKSTSVTTTDGKQEDKTSEVKEEKKSDCDTSNVGYKTRAAALASVDVLYYNKAQRGFQSMLTKYMATLNFMDLNKDKLEKPKGSQGSSSGYSSMY